MVLIAPKAHFRRELGSSPVVENQGVTGGYIFMVLFGHRIKVLTDTGIGYKLKSGMA